MRFKDAEVIICRNQTCHCLDRHKAKCLYFRIYDKELDKCLKKSKIYYPILDMLQNKKSVSLLNLKSDNDVLRLVAETMIFKKCPEKICDNYIKIKNEMGLNNRLRALPPNNLGGWEWKTINTFRN
jgi:hypothetical protein